MRVHDSKSKLATLMRLLLLLRASSAGRTCLLLKAISASRNKALLNHGRLASQAVTAPTASSHDLTPLSLMRSTTAASGTCMNGEPKTILLWLSSSLPATRLARQRHHVSADAADAARWPACKTRSCIAPVLKSFWFSC
jgi:hypothetical protein